MPPASSTQVLLLRLKTFFFTARAPSQEVSGVERSPWRHSLDRREMLIEPPLTARMQHQFAVLLPKRKSTSAGRKICNNEGWNWNFAGYLLSNKNVPKSLWISRVLDRRFFRVGLHNTYLPCKPFVFLYKLLLSKCHQNLEVSVTGALPSALLLFSFPKVGGEVNKRKLYKCLCGECQKGNINEQGCSCWLIRCCCYKALCAG